MRIIENKKSGEMHFIIKDSGTGFELEDLPKAVLLSGFSTKGSMGQGFTIMRKICNKIQLFTTETGSTLILSFNLPRANQKEKKIHNEQLTALTSS